MWAGVTAKELTGEEDWAETDQRDTSSGAGVAEGEATPQERATPPLRTHSSRRKEKEQRDSPSSPGEGKTLRKLPEAQQAGDGNEDGTRRTEPPCSHSHHTTHPSSDNTWTKINSGPLQGGPGHGKKPSMIQAQKDSKMGWQIRKTSCNPNRHPKRRESLQEFAAHGALKALTEQNLHGAQADYINSAPCAGCLRKTVPISMLKYQVSPSLLLYARCLAFKQKVRQMTDQEKIPLAVKKQSTQQNHNSELTIMVLSYRNKLTMIDVDGSSEKGDDLHE